MNRGTFNGFITNGASIPQWVVRAALVAAAAATIINSDGVRTAFGVSTGAAQAIVVSALQTQTHAGAGTNSSTAAAALDPTIIYAGRASVLAQATGNAAVRRDVFAEAGGDATATGEAIVASALGYANADALATVVDCTGHIIFPARASTFAYADYATASGDVTRYTRVYATAGVIYDRAEASYQLSGETFVHHEGFAPFATAGATASIPNDQITLTVHNAANATSGCTGTAKAFETYPARAPGLGVATATAFAVRGPAAYSLGNALATGAGTGTRVVLPTSLAVGAASSLNVKALMNYRGASLANAGATLVSAPYTRKTFGLCTGAMATSYLVAATQGTNYKGIVNVTALATAQTVWGMTKFAAGGYGNALASNDPIYYGQQFFGTTINNGVAIATAKPDQQFVATALGNAVGSAGAMQYGRQFRGNAFDSGIAKSVQPNANLIQVGLVNAQAVATGSALGIANSDKMAPDDRYMMVEAEDRSMLVSVEDRIMKVTA